VLKQYFIEGAEDIFKIDAENEKTLSFREIFVLLKEARIAG